MRKLHSNGGASRPEDHYATSRRNRRSSPAHKSLTKATKTMSFSLRTARVSVTFFDRRGGAASGESDESWWKPAHRAHRLIPLPALRLRPHRARHLATRSPDRARPSRRRPIPGKAHYPLETQTRQASPERRLRMRSRMTPCKPSGRKSPPRPGDPRKRLAGALASRHQPRQRRHAFCRRFQSKLRERP